jgi:serine/threonine-protein kinase
MPQFSRCPSCRRELVIPDGAAGKFRCPLCRQIFALRAAAAPGPVMAAATSVPAAKAAASSTRPETAASVSAPKPRPFAPPVSRASAPASRCPSCSARLSGGALACPECGYLLQSDAEVIDSEEAANLCPNTACGVANAPGERICQRCSSPLPLPAGTLLQGRYRIDKLLAIGGFAAVYRAQDQREGRVVAVKDMICPEPQEFSIRLNFFQREAAILRALAGNPVVPRLFEFVQDGEAVHLVLEYIAGQDLLKLLEANGHKPFPFEQVVSWGLSICDVLIQLHSLKPPVVHRDVKPENVMLLEDRQSIKMIDFGTARGVGGSQKTRLASKTRVFTEGYAPPEQILGKPEARSDLFALAGTLYHLATGKAPEGHYTARELETQLRNGSALPPGERWLYELIQINLAEDANDRYFSCREFRADLERRQVTRETPCPKCHAMNPVRHPYCIKCAAPLTDLSPPCNQCGKENRLGSRCCIHCGCRLR